MKIRFITLFIIAVAMSACTKMQDVKPVTSDLTGLWLSDAKDMQLQIHDTKGHGEVVTYTDVKTDTGRYLVITAAGQESVYKISALSKSDMLLTDQQQVSIHLNKVREW